MHQGQGHFGINIALHQTIWYRATKFCVIIHCQEGILLGSNHFQSLERGSSRITGGVWSYHCSFITRSSADADNGLDAFSGQSRSTNMVPFWVHCDFLLSM